MTIQTIDIDELGAMQRAVGEWAEENFGTEQPPDYPVIGAGEELGELTRSVLKRAQGIDDDEKYEQRDDVGPEAERDAVGDVVIYLMDACHRSDDDITVAGGLDQSGDVGSSFGHIEEPIECVKGLYGYYGEVTTSRFYLISDEEWGDPDEYEWKSEEDDLGVVEWRIGHLVGLLVRFCQIRDYDFMNCVRDAWQEVSGRTWDADIAVETEEKTDG